MNIATIIDRFLIIADEFFLSVITDRFFDR